MLEKPQGVIRHVSTAALAHTRARREPGRRARRTDKMRFGRYPLVKGRKRGPAAIVLTALPPEGIDGIVTDVRRCTIDLPGRVCRPGSCFPSTDFQTTSLVVRSVSKQLQVFCVAPADLPDAVQ